MAKNHEIDGAGVAAKILSRIPENERETIFASIAAESPKIAANLKRRVVDLGRVEKLKGPALQNLLHEIPVRDLAISLKTAPEAVKQRIIDNVSKTKLRAVQDEAAALPPMKVPDIEAAQNRILKRLEDLYPEQSTIGTTIEAPLRVRPRLI